MIDSENAAVVRRAIKSPEDDRKLSAAHISFMLRSVDIIAIIISSLLTYVVLGVLRGDSFQLAATDIVGPTAIGALTYSFVAHMFRCYWRTNYLSGFIIAARVGLSWTLSIVVLIVMAFLLKSSAEYSRQWSVAWYIDAYMMIIFVRFAIAAKVRRFARNDAMAERLLLVGTEEKVRKLKAVLKSSAENDSIKIVSTVILRGIASVGGTNIEYFVQKIKDIDADFDTIIISDDKQDLDLVKGVVLKFVDSSKELLALCDPLELMTPVRAYRSIGGVPLLILLERPISGWRQISKRIEDLIVALLMILFLAPLIIIISVAVVISSRGPILFRQPRYGLDGHVFNVLKFRTMYHNMSDYEANQLTTKNDRRVTRLGKFLRRTSLDELPQLFNVLIGNMSVVGPRPHALSARAGGQLYEDLYDAYMARHRVKPGITGLAQIKGWRGETDSSDKLIKRVDYDLEYIDKWSLALDIFIIFATPISLLRFRNVY